MKIEKLGKQKGFTIIELVVVILLLGILTATALPRFMDVTTQAHGAVVNGVQGALQTGASLYHAQWVANGQPASGALTGFGTGNVVTNAAGYPDGVGANLVSAAVQATADAGCVAIFQNVLQEGAPDVDISEASPAAPAVFGGAPFEAYADMGTETCNYAYVGSGAITATVVYNSTLGTVVTN